jgi:hypothetical protein
MWTGKYTAFLEKILPTSYELCKEVIFSCETLVSNCKSAWCHNPEEQCCNDYVTHYSSLENLKPHMYTLCNKNQAFEIFKFQAINVQLLS